MYSPRPLERFSSRVSVLPRQKWQQGALPPQGLELEPTRCHALEGFTAQGSGLEVATKVWEPSVEVCEVDSEVSGVGAKQSTAGDG